jgi:sialidase-1
MLLLTACLVIVAHSSEPGPVLPATCQAKLDEWCNTPASTGEGCAAERQKAKCLLGGKPQQFVARRSTSGWQGTTLEWRCYAPSVLDPTRTHFVNGSCYCTEGAKLRDVCLGCANEKECGPQPSPLPSPKPAPPPPDVATTTVFEKGDSGYEAFRIPGMLAFRDTLMVFAEGRKYGCGDFAGQHDVVYKRSTDRGKSFSKLQVLMDPAKMFGESQCPAANRSTETGSCEFWDPTPFADSVTGDVHFITTRSWAHAGMNNEASRMEGMMDCWLVSSSDTGRTWGSPRNITSEVWSKTWNMMTPSNGHAIQTSTGRLLVSGYVRTNGSQMSAVMYSDDGAKTWSFAPNSTVGLGTSESEVVELQHTRGKLMFDHRKSGTRYRSYSTDDGLTWEGFSPVPELPDPGCKGGIASWPAKKALLFTNPATTHGRVNITLRVSTDDGETWPVEKRISGPGGYSDVQLATLHGKDSACVVFEYDTCTIKVGCIDGASLLP